MTPYFSRDDIAQIASPAGASPTGIVRLSGEGVFRIARQCVGDLPTDVFGERRRGVFDGTCVFPLVYSLGPGLTVEEEFSCPARILVMPGPASYTREDAVELHVPGAPAVLGAVLTAVTRCGARLAAPGEFTFRAFRNGRLSLGQAEAVEEAILAGNAAERQAALSRLGDINAAAIMAWRDRAMAVAAQVEASLDFAEEDLGEDAAREIRDLIADLEREGVRPDDGGKAVIDSGSPQVALHGLANAGKSSLANALLGEDAFLVAAEASTTRDSLRREVVWDGTRLALSDNPGHHSAGEGGAGAAAALSMRRMGSGDAICWVVDASSPITPELREFAALLNGRILIALNKEDLPAVIDKDMIAGLLDGAAPEAVVAVSAADGSGIETLREEIVRMVRQVVVHPRWNKRENAELATALYSCRQALEEMDGAGRLELAAEELRRAVTAFSKTLGEGYAEDVLERIFSRFCLGK